MIFFLSLLMLVLGAVILNTLSHNPEIFGMVIFQDLVVRIYLIIWLFHLLDYCLLLYLARPNRGLFSPAFSTES